MRIQSEWQSPVEHWLQSGPALKSSACQVLGRPTGTVVISTEQGSCGYTTFLSMDRPLKFFTIYNCKIKTPPLPDTHTLFSIFLKERTNNLLSSTETGKHQESGGFLLWTEKSSDFLNSNKVVSEAREGRGTYIKQSLPQTTGALPPSDLLLGSASSSLFLLSGILTSSSALHPAQPCLWSSCHPV